MIRSTRRGSVSGKERRWLKVFGTLNEFQARLFAADKALDLGRGGISRLSVLTGLSRTTITKAVEELQSGKLVNPGEDRVRRAGGGRKKVEGADPGIRDLLEKILEETTAGDPMRLDQNLNSWLPPPIFGRSGGCGIRQYPVGLPWPSFGVHNWVRSLQIVPQNRVCPPLVRGRLSLGTGGEIGL